MIVLKTVWNEPADMPGFRSIANLAILSTVLTATSALSMDKQSFDPMEAFCDRQTFALESIGEVLPWLEYLSGMREARAAAPELDCPSSTVRAIYNVFASPNEDAAKAQRHAFLYFYISKAMGQESSERAMDQDGSFRYLNDMTLASFGWLLCPGTGAARTECARGLFGSFPDEYLRTSPVLCDFSNGDKSAVEWPRTMDTPPLSCSPRTPDRQAAAGAWLSDLHTAAR